MKKYLVLILGVILFACTQQTGYEININLEGGEGQILLEQRGTSAWIPVDTVEIVDGVAILEGEVAVPGEYYLSVLGQREKTIIFVENEKMTFIGKVDSLSMADITGSATHDEYKSVDNKIKKISEEYMKLYQQSREVAAAGDVAKAEELMVQVNEMYE
ncbi:MAG: DUF4369 domain-containing protein, partial [Prolixibacteraceae bacterium]|nr:DUF4369 domain-containing protein [Prolixibacteraceae bacterium]